MNIRDMVIDRVVSLGCDGLVNTNAECGCGETHGWFLCDTCDVHECRAAKWHYCKSCDLNGYCELQIEWNLPGNDNDGCYRVAPGRDHG